MDRPCLVGLFAASWAPALLAACARPPQPGAASTAATSPATADRVATGDAAWAGRGTEDALKEAIAAYEAALTAGAVDRHVLGQLTRAWYFWGDAYSPDKTVQIERWSKALDYGNACLDLNPAIATARANGQRDRDAAALGTAEDVPCLYWTATALGKWAKAKGISNTLANLPTVKAYIGQVESLDPSYFHYGPARYWGAFYAALPSFAGQDFGKSAQYFDAAVQGAPYYLATRGLRAELLAVAKGDVAMFDADIAFILAADPNAEPARDVAPENSKEQEKARALLARRAELFDKDALTAAGPGPAPTP